MKKRSSNYSLHEDLLIEILSLLPVKSLLRFKCVCKSWYNIISSTIASKHLSNSKNSDHRRLIIGHRSHSCESDDYIILSSDSTNEVISGDFRFDSQYRPSRQRLLGSYNGIVCLADETREKVLFWNPTTRQLKVVPQSNEHGLAFRAEHAFGYDFNTDDYKVMRFNTMTTHGPSSRCKIEVYSSKTDTWRNSDAVIPDGLYFSGNSYKRPKTCVGGIYSTMVCERAIEGEVGKCYLFTIDMSNEGFILTPMPPEVAIFGIRKRWYDNALTEVNKSVAFITTIRNDDERYFRNGSFEIFVLNEYGPNGIWTKLYTIAPLSKLLSESSPIGFWRDELLLCFGGDLVLCDPIAREEEIVKLGGGFFQILEYKESLVWIIEQRYHRS